MAGVCSFVMTRRIATEQTVYSSDLKTLNMITYAYAGDINFAMDVTSISISYQLFSYFDSRQH